MSASILQIMWYRYNRIFVDIFGAIRKVFNIIYVDILVLASHTISIIHPFLWIVVLVELAYSFIMRARTVWTCVLIFCYKMISDTCMRFVFVFLGRIPSSPNLILYSVWVCIYYINHFKTFSFFQDDHSWVFSFTEPVTVVLTKEERAHLSSKVLCGDKAATVMTDGLKQN